MSKPLEPYQLALYAAADYMQEHGWTRGELVSADGKVCLLGALSVALSGSTSFVHPPLPGTYDCRTYNIAYLVLQRLTGHRPDAWNDTRCNSTEEAVKMLRKAATVGGNVE